MDSVWGITFFDGYTRTWGFFKRLFTYVEDVNFKWHGHHMINNNFLDNGPGCLSNDGFVEPVVPKKQA